jgi:hypothetical protein
LSKRRREEELRINADGERKGRTSDKHRRDADEEREIGKKSELGINYRFFVFS